MITVRPRWFGRRHPAGPPTGVSESLRRPVPLVALTLILTGCGGPSEDKAGRWTDGAQPFSAPVKLRWYIKAQVLAGQRLYQRHCAECHREDASGSIDWKRRDAAGNLPPPPLNGNAHAWHHPLSKLRQVVRVGGAPWGGTMPPFADKLNKQQIDAILAWVQTHWSDDIYAAWIERGGTTK